MIKNYFKTAWRNLFKSKFYTLINISGLTMGLTVGMLILIWVQDEKSFDSFHQQSNQIYRLENRVGTGASIQIWEQTVAPIGKLAEDQIPEVKDYIRMTYNGYKSLFQYKDKVFNESKSFFTDPSLFSVFDFKIIEGDKNNPFRDDHFIVITKSTAAKYFGAENPIGKTIVLDHQDNLVVSGVINDIPKNSTIQGDIFLSMSFFEKIIYKSNETSETLNSDFHQFMYDTYLLLQNGASTEGLAQKLKQIHLSNKPDDTDIVYLLEPLKDLHLFHADGTDGGIETVRMFTIIALLILVIACINYINLSTARSVIRSKEVSLRKILGADKPQLFFQFVVETTMLFLLSSVLAIGLMYLLIPLFNDISNKQLSINLSNMQIWKVLGLTILATLIASSIYPAILLSSFEPLKALKGKISNKMNDVTFRRVLVVVQFTFSMALISGTFIISQQLKYIQSKNLGYDKENVIAFYMGGMSNHFDAVKNELLKQPDVKGVTRASANPINIGQQTGSNEWDGKQEGETMMMRPISIDENFIPFFKMKFAEGNNFTGAVSDSTHFILNETAVQTARINNPIGKRFKLWNTEGTIIGVVKDFHFASMRNKIEPLVMYHNAKNMNLIYIKTDGEGTATTLAKVEDLWKSYNKDVPFSCNFLDDSFKKLYQYENQKMTLFNVFAVIAIIISCLGLFGLSTYTSELRKREIGVRKVLGANIWGVIRLVSIDFLKLVCIAILIATPISWFVMNTWLNDFAYKIELGWIVFALAGLSIGLIAFATVSFQAVKAALANPIKSLRTE
jgi:putative ABC transport system permease protein